MKIALLGDIGFFGKYSASNDEGVYEYFKSLAEHLATFDYVVGNLEVPFVENASPIGAKSAHVKSDPININLLKYLNINVVCLANNHVYDFGMDGVATTLNLLEQHGIRYFGIDQKDCVLEDCKVALHGYCCYSTNPYGLDKVVNTLNIPIVEQKITKYHQDNYLSIVGVHAGFEHVNYPAYHDIRMARKLAKVCPYVYYGHHPHVLQGMESVNGSLLAYSMGNLCFDDVYTSKSDQPLVKQSDNNKTSVVLELDVEDGKLISHQTTGIYADTNTLAVGVAGVNEKLEAYSQYLNTEENEYNEYRRNLMAKYIDGRKQMRDFNWYVKRLNFNSIIMILRSKYNSWQHKRNVLVHLDDKPTS